MSYQVRANLKVIKENFFKKRKGFLQEEENPSFLWVGGVFSPSRPQNRIRSSAVFAVGGGEAIRSHAFLHRKRGGGIFLV